MASVMKEMVPVAETDLLAPQKSVPGSSPKSASRLPAMKVLAFGSTMLASAMLNNIFVSYYLDFYLNVMKISPAAFYFGQAVFMAWNSINDLLFGWISDSWSPEGADGKRDRLPQIRWGGFLWAVSFFMVWFPWGEGAWVQGANFAFVLCFYDAMLTFVEVNHGALLADITSDSNERAKYNMYSAFCAAFGSCSSFFGHMFWTTDREQLGNFRMFCLLVSLCSCVCFEFTAQHLKQDDSAGSSKDESSSKHDGVEVEAGRPDFQTFAGQLAKHKNFVLVATVSIFQQFDCTFGKNFFTLFLSSIVGGQMSRSMHSMVVAASFILPWVTTVWVTQFVQLFGLYECLSAIFRARLLLLSSALVPFLYFSEMPWWGCVGLLLLNRVASEAVCRLLPLVKSDLVDEDMYLNNRPQTMSASIIGTLGFFSRPSQSIAPIVGYRLMGHQLGSNGAGEEGVGGLDVEVDNGIAAATVGTVANELVTAQQRFNDCRTLIMVPFIVVVVQLAIWHFYSLRGQYFATVKKWVKSRHANDMKV
jgi:Na+/melibiose symporter-like transporter